MGLPSGPSYINGTPLRSVSSRWQSLALWLEVKFIVGKQLPLWTGKVTDKGTVLNAAG